MSSKYRITILIVLLAHYLSACSTFMLWEEPQKREVVWYDETISHFLITEDGEKIVFIGEKYHYVFSNQNSLSNILKWPSRKLLKARFNKSFVVNSSNKVFGEYAIICDNRELTKEQEQWLFDNGFIIKIFDGKAVFIFESEISGDLYLAKDLNFEKSAKLNNQYKITVRIEKKSLLENNYVKAALTPIAVAEDGVLVIGTAALLVVAIPFVAINLLDPPDEFYDELFEQLGRGY